MTSRSYVFDELDEAVCRRLLASVPIGRLGYTEAALPRILPVHFTVRGDDVVIGSLNGSKVRSAARGDVVAFEADSYDPLTHEGWCVNVIGVSRILTDRDEVAALDALAFTPWAPHQDRHYFAVRMDTIQGRSLARSHDRVLAVSES
jgi:nitroimidazol reductase NimA-like FMN-containing flavoprotein (pyridoxamine 5'-phosphate oxidase superfamily)